MSEGRLNEWGNNFNVESRCGAMINNCAILRINYLFYKVEPLPFFPYFLFSSTSLDVDDLKSTRSWLWGGVLLEGARREATHQTIFSLPAASLSKGGGGTWIPNQGLEGLAESQKKKSELPCFGGGSGH